jgi:hypothetical protein
MWWRTTTAMYHREDGLGPSSAIAIYSVLVTYLTVAQYFLEGSAGGNGG